MSEDYLFMTFDGTVTAFRKYKTRVILSTGHYRPSPNNPTAGSEFECAGTIVRVRSDLTDNRVYPLSVCWDNGRYNDYHSKDLSVVGGGEELKDSNPNVSFKHKKKLGTGLHQKSKYTFGQARSECPPKPDTDCSDEQTEDAREECLSEPPILGEGVYGWEEIDLNDEVEKLREGRPLVDSTTWKRVIRGENLS